jgi:hypothetical protein
MHKVKIKFIVHTSIAVVVFFLLAVIASIKLASAGQLGLASKLAILGFLWALPVYWTYVFVRDYKKLDEYDLDSNDRTPWSSGSGQLSHPQSMLKNIFWGVIFLAGTLMASWGMVTYVSDAFKALSCKNWPSTTGIVISSTAVRGGNKSYYPEILYEYKVGVTSYKGNRLVFGNVGAGSESDAQERASRYPAGVPIRVYFDPKIPSEAVIMAGQIPNGTWWGILAFPFMIIGSAFASWSFLRNIPFS